MKQTTRRHALTLLGSTMLAACTEAPGVLVPTEGDPLEGGIGGTGIVGVLVGFGSLLVNGLRVETTASTRYSTAFGRTGLDGLAPGLPLTVYAQRTRDRLIARDVVVDYTLIGTVHHGAGGITVNGIPVRAEAGAHGRLVPGTRAAIGGTWTRSGVSASFIAPAPDVPDLVAGTVQSATRGLLKIGGLDIQHGGVTPAAGQYAVVLGRAEAGGFAAQEVQSARFRRAPGLRQLSVDGYLEPIAQAPGFRIAGLGHSFARDVRLGAIGGRRAIYFGRYDGLFGASQSYAVPDSFAQRQRLLQNTQAPFAQSQLISL